MFRIALCGFSMALADTIPGVSGSTVAFIMGLYDSFITSLHAIIRKKGEERKAGLCFILKLGIGWVIGLVSGILFLSALFEKQAYFMSSFFLALTLSALPLIIRDEADALRKKEINLIFTLLGAALVIVITLLRGENTAFDFSSLSPSSILYVMVSGMAAIAAMVLPGISGSSILLTAGVYIPAMKAARQFLSLDFSVFPGLAALAIGIILGAILIVALVQKALSNNRSRMIYFILGLTAGSVLPIIRGPLSLGREALSFSTFSIPGFLLGAVLIITLFILEKRKVK